LSEAFSFLIENPDEDTHDPEKPFDLLPGADGLADDRADGATLSAGQSLYLPVYSHLYHGEFNSKTGKPSETLVSTHVSIRNTDPKLAIRVNSARYYDTEGKLLREYLPKPKSVPPLGTL
jgi:hypothetical protein